MCLCHLGDVIEIISRRWAPQIIAVIGNNPKLRFNRLMGKLGKISPKTLSDRLKELETAGLIRREFFAEIPPRVEYTLTKDGMELRNALAPLMEWASSKNLRKRQPEFSSK
ncbi:helix-turn-helix domain-containing protein [Candidatus Hecatella orcuttiae]|uniref:winged helix-turn-helix transcriptional regulator n=1 Tax=Candidatus Hecatella orcuttiae TaxID=1935119 RepID=UPI002867F9F8|nr:helix-turn-helix domain-containing protein [Candidatus Hecatella orcuttiae]